MYVPEWVLLTGYLAILLGTTVFSLLAGDRVSGPLMATFILSVGVVAAVGYWVGRLL